MLAIVAEARRLVLHFYFCDYSFGAFHYIYWSFIIKTNGYLISYSERTLNDAGGEIVLIFAIFQAA